MPIEQRPWKNTLQELMKLRGGAFQVAQYVAVISSLKRSLDDWVPVPQFDAYRRLVLELGLAIEVDCVFRRLSASHTVFGLRYAPQLTPWGTA